MRKKFESTFAFIRNGNLKTIFNLIYTDNLRLVRYLAVSPVKLKYQFLHEAVRINNSRCRRIYGCMSVYMRLNALYFIAGKQPKVIYAVECSLPKEFFQIAAFALINSYDEFSDFSVTDFMFCTKLINQISAFDTGLAF